MSRIKSSKLENIFNHVLQFRLKKNSNKFCRKCWLLTEVAHIFGIGIPSIYRWLSPPNLEVTKVKVVK